MGELRGVRDNLVVLCRSGNRERPERRGRQGFLGPQNNIGVINLGRHEHHRLAGIQIGTCMTIARVLQTRHGVAANERKATTLRDGEAHRAYAALHASAVDNER